ncbi:MAG: hypothetical protein ACI8TX_003689 [Hyphomicrobiaceae bacterium]|jgi:hypothetical protein
MHSQIRSYSFRLAAIRFTSMLLLASALMIPGASPAQADASARCERLLLRAAGSIARCRLNAMAKATRTGEQDYTRCEQALDRVMARVAEKTGGKCGTEQDRADVDGNTDDAISTIANGFQRGFQHGEHTIGCEQVRCPVGSECRIETIEFPTCVDSCANVDCPEGSVCRLTPGICPALFGFPCPDVAQCVPANRCTDPACERWQECRFHEESDTGYCADTCAKCRPDERCVVLETPCPGPEFACPPVVICEEPPRHPCELIDCAPNQICRVDPATRQGFCADTCRGVECDEGEACLLVDVECITSPCPPIAECRPLQTCQLPPEVGDCDAAIPRLFFDARTGRCQRFIWGGCGGNANNFETLQQCADTCGVRIDHPLPH